MERWEGGSRVVRSRLEKWFDGSFQWCRKTRTKASTEGVMCMAIPCARTVMQQVGFYTTRWVKGESRRCILRL